MARRGINRLWPRFGDSIGRRLIASRPVAHLARHAALDEYASTLDLAK
jgi:hypothetical protein